MKSYSLAPDADTVITNMQHEHHLDLDGVTVTALFVFDLEATEPVLKHQGYPAAAVVRITPVRDRALGIADATVVIDRSTWLTLSQRQRDALVDHELTHLNRVLDEDTELPLTDAVDRPKLAMRRHDLQIGIFTEILERHGEASYEAKMAKAVLDIAGQMQLNFAKPPGGDEQLAQHAKQAAKMFVDRIGAMGGGRISGEGIDIEIADTSAVTT
jgi:ABC-type branched-subunit amino acid transport system substrate-binding protein